jgi:hypothetical protein
VSAPYGMTVGQLKAILNSMPDSFADRVVVLSSDAEGNSFDTLSEVAVGFLRLHHDCEFRGFSASEDGDTWSSLDAQALADYTTDEDDGTHVPLDEYDHLAICLWP